LAPNATNWKNWQIATNLLWLSLDAVLGCHGQDWQIATNWHQIPQFAPNATEMTEFSAEFAPMGTELTESGPQFTIWPQMPQFAPNATELTESCPQFTIWHQMPPMGT
jgi:hypothetical protein